MQIDRISIIEYVFIILFFYFCLGAHRKKAHEIVAIAGTLDPSLASEASNRQVSEGAEVLLAPGYVDGTRLDLALIRLKRPFKWRNDLVLPVCLPLLTANDPRFSQRGGGVRVNKTLDSTKTGEKKKEKDWSSPPSNNLLPVLPSILHFNFALYCASPRIPFRLQSRHIIRKTTKGHRKWFF